ncbi:hydantoinase B/oxoprolinase family protein [Pseudoroseicyclus tamaricis]|uniref:Hydantoinase B/oxoprolinase family protein n=1 Tax=Pseudoroseicyclus tamaricis TaxID=2705421 RepID=A0A6B2JQX2_9RHOB|nr:hydantoinase B/oxoprolinase family protein [Pseudoroseicyclus tamaricis]NDV00558.1 hydantoinase B/oxoprolinase family protein [Pseudoroseicyclus tamaricis]
MTLDPVLQEIFLHKFTAITEEMAITLQRSARTTYVKEAGDFGTALATPDGHFFCYPAVLGVSGFLDSDIGPTVARVPDLEPGDVIITNHPYESEGLATHMPDLHLIRPIFHEGKIIAHAWDFIHSADIGGAVPSSISPRFRDLFEEGLQIPPMKIARAGVLNEDFLQLYRANCRTPDVNLGDIKAMLAALRVAERRILELVDLYGVETFLAAQTAVVDYASQKALAVQKTIPDGTYSFWDFLDDDYNSAIPVRVRCKLTVEAGKVHLDFAGSDPQVAAAYNIPTAGKRHPWLTLKMMHFIFSNDRSIPLNYGVFRHMTVNAPRGSILNPEPPAAVGIRSATAIRVNEALMGAVAAARPELIPAPSGGIMIPLVLVEQDEATGERSVLVLQSLVGGTGARHGSDGVDGRDSSLANQRNTPIEKTEEEAEAVIVDYSLRTDSGGPGRWRGGTGVAFSVRIAKPGSAILGRGMERFVFPPWGMNGGRPGAKARVIVNPGTPGEIDLGKIDIYHPKVGDIVTVLTPGGGGHGDPLARDPADVEADVRLGYVSAEAARADYGVALSGGLVDAEETERLRAQLKGERGDSAGFNFGPEREAWESVFDDTVMTELNALLMTLGTSVRSERRAQIFYNVVPGLEAGKGKPIETLIGDPAAARDRLAKELDNLRQQVAARIKEEARP